MPIERLNNLEKEISRLEGAALEIRPENSPHYPEIVEMLRGERKQRKNLIAE